MAEPPFHRQDLCNSAEFQIRRISSTLQVHRPEWCGSRKLLHTILLVLSLVNIISNISLTFVLMFYVIDEKTFHNPAISVCITILTNGGFCIFYILRGIFKEKQYYICNYSASLFVTLIYCVVDMIYNEAAYQVLHAVRLSILVGLSVPNLVLCAKVCQHFSWTNFKIVGASEAIQAMYNQLCYFCSLLTFDLQVSLCFVVLRLNHHAKISIYSVAILATGIPFSALFNIIGYVAVQWELKKLVYLFSMLCVLQPAYIIYDAVRMYIDIYSFNDDLNFLILYAILATGSISVTIRLIIMCELRTVYRNFGFGLQDKAFVGLVACEKTSLLSPSSM